MDVEETDEAPCPVGGHGASGLWVTGQVYSALPFEPSTFTILCL